LDVGCPLASNARVEAEAPILMINLS